ncbi:gustatory receptor [Homalodisca vitripennis]|nr:gustatory receptor [Homalodisca vitripennis]
MIRKCLKDSFPWWFFPLYRSLGILPLHPNSQGIRFDPKTAPVGIVLLTMALLSFTYGLIGYSFPANIPLLKQGVWLLTGFSGIIGALISTSVMVIQCKKNRFGEIIETIAAAEKLIVVEDRSRVGIFHQLDKITVGMYVLLTCFLIPLTIFYQNSDNSKAVLVMSCCSQFFTLSMELIFIRLALLIATQFKRLNKNVQQNYRELPTFLAEKKNFKTLSTGLQECVLPIQEIRQCHLLLSKALKDTNSVFMIQLTCTFMNLFIHAIVNPSFIIDSFVQSRNSYLATISMLIQLLWFLFSLTSLVSITWTCTYTTYHGKRSAFFISNLLSLELPSVYRKQVKRALLQVCGNTVEFTIQDFFKIDIKIITSFAGMALTYLIVILQFDSATPHKKPTS